MTALVLLLAGVGRLPRDTLYATYQLADRCTTWKTNVQGV